MNRSPRAALGSLFLLAVASACTAPPAPLLERAIAAKGGARLEEPAAFVRRAAGTWRGLGFREVATLVRQGGFQRDWALEVPGEPSAFSVTLVYDGQSVRQVDHGVSAPPPPGAGLQLRDRWLDEVACWLVDLREPSMTKAEEGDAVYHGRDVHVLRLEHSSGYKRFLFFDQETLDLVGLAGMAHVESGRRSVEWVFADHESLQGIRVPRRFEQWIEGELQTEGRNVGLELLREAPDLPVTP